MTSTERAVRKASRERLLRDFAWAARLVEQFAKRSRNTTLTVAESCGSRTRYACLMTAFGQ